MVNTIHYDPRASGHTMATRPRKLKGDRRPREEEGRITLSDPGERIFDLKSLSWILPLAEGPTYERPCDLGVTPIWDGSGVLWDVVDGSGKVFWTIEAASFDRALAEKKRLCVTSGYRPGWAKIRQLCGQSL